MSQSASNRSHIKRYQRQRWLNIYNLIRAKWTLDRFFGLIADASVVRLWYLVANDPEISKVQDSVRKIWQTYINHDEWRKNFVREEDMITIILAFQAFQKSQKREHPPRILNVGFAKGMSYLCFRELLPNATIDTIEIDPDLVDDFQSRILSFFSGNHSQHTIFIGSSVGLNPKSIDLNEKLKKRFSGIEKHLHLVEKLLSLHSYALIFLDGDHTKSHVLQELAVIYENRRAPNQCLVALHDAARDPGQALDEFGRIHNLKTIKINMQPHSPRLGFVVI